MKYHHLTRDQRSQINALKSMNHTQKDIARIVGVSRSTISRELKRNSGLKGYRYKQADKFANERRALASQSPKKMTSKLIKYIEEKIVTDKWSPEQISGILKANSISISHTCIYQHVWEDKLNGGIIFKSLRHQGKKYNYKGGKKAGRGVIPNRIDISARPKIVDKKKRLGDWEADTIVGAKHKGAIVSLVDRKSKFTLLAHVKKGTAEEVTKAIINLLKNQTTIPVRTITFDNGKEFSNHTKISKVLKTECYFARPYHSWERGLNEHTNGLVRQYYPKGTEFVNLCPKEILFIQNQLNKRPRKVLKYRTPWEVLLGRTGPHKVALQG